MFDKLNMLRHFISAKYLRKFPNRESLMQWQNKRLQYVLKRASKTFEFYYPYQNKKYENFPIINKTILMTHFAELNAQKISREFAFEIAAHAEKTRDFTQTIGNIAVGLSSGTSGLKGLFLVNQSERCRWAGTVLAKCLPEPVWKKRRIAFLFRSNNHLYSTINSSNRIQFRFFDLINPIDEIITALNKFSPDIFIAPAHVLGYIAKMMLTSENIIKFMPERVISVGEVLDDFDHQLIKHAFKQTVHQVYQATEGFLASTCRFGTLHLNEDLVYIEREYQPREQKRFVPIITDLFRQTQAIIRYRLDDILMIRESPCPCGSVFQALEKVEGRCDDVIYAPDVVLEHHLKPIYPDLIRNKIVANYANAIAFDYKIVQTDLNQLKLYLDCDDHLKIGNIISDILKNLFSQLHVKLPQIAIEKGLSKDIAKKFRRIERTFTVGELPN